RTLGELSVRANRFVVAVRGRKIVGGAELAPLSPHVAEVRSLAVDGSARGSRVGVTIVDELRRRARREAFEKLCAFTHAPGYFVHMGFSIVPHLWLTEKIFTDCVKCPQFRQCGQYAMVVPLAVAFDAERGYALPSHPVDHAPAASRAASSSPAAARTRAPVKKASPPRARRRWRWRASSTARSSRCSSPRPASSASRCRSRRFGAACRPRSARSAPIRARRRHA